MGSEGTKRDDVRHKRRRKRMSNPLVITQLNEKWALVQDIHQLRAERGIMVLLKLLDTMIDEIRLENDSVAKEQLEYNQGKIAVCRALKENIEKGLPTIAQGIGKPGK